MYHPPQAQSNKINRWWTGSSQTLSQNPTFLFVHLRCLAIVREKWLTHFHILHSQSVPPTIHVPFSVFSLKTEKACYTLPAEACTATQVPSSALSTLPEQVKGPIVWLLCSWGIWPLYMKELEKERREGGKRQNSLRELVSSLVKSKSGVDLEYLIPRKWRWGAKMTTVKL